jgi:hypothetical protein
MILLWHQEHPEIFLSPLAPELPTEKVKDGFKFIVVKLDLIL